MCFCYYDFFAKCNLENATLNDDKLYSEREGKHFEIINKKIDLSKKKSKRPYTSISNYGENYDNITNKVLNNIDNMISKIKEIDLHNYTSDGKSQYFGKSGGNNNFFEEGKKIEQKFNK